MLSLTLAAALISSAAAQYAYPSNLPAAGWQEGQTGTNQCDQWGSSSQSSMCQNAFINSVNDFCLWAPPSKTSAYGDSSVGNTEREMVSWCLQPGYGTRLIPDRTISGAHFVITAEYIQVTGSGDFTSMNIPAGDDGGELDPHGADGLGNPIGGLTFTKAFDGSYRQITEWTNFMSSNNFCFKACIGNNAAAQCQHIYDVLGCGFTVPGNGGGGFDQCAGDVIAPPGVYGASTFHQGDPTTPAPHPAAATSQCQYFSSVGNGLNAGAAVPTAGSNAASVSSSASVASSTSIASSSSASASASASSSMVSASSSIAASSASSAQSSSRASSSSAALSSMARSASASASALRSSASAAAASASNTSDGGVSVAVIGWSAVAGVVGLLGGALLL